MKYLIFFLLISNSIFAQRSTHVKLLPVGYGVDTIYANINDTINVMMLVCDTSQFVYEKQFIRGEKTSNGFVDYFITDTIYTGEYDNRVWWMFGKEVKTLNDGVILMFNDSGNLNFSYKNKKYLDADGNELRDEIVVWQTKEIKRQK